MGGNLTRDLWSGLTSDLEVILFDLDGTLRHNRPGADQALFDRAVELGVKDDPEKKRVSARWAHYYWAQSAELMVDIKTYGESSDEFWKNYVIRSLLTYGCEREYAANLAPQLLRFMQEDYQPVEFVSPDVPETLGSLKEAGFRLGVLSNRNQPCHEVLRDLGLDIYFEMSIVAGEVASWKPDPEIFEQALKRMHAEPQHAIYVGDNYFADVFGARNAGIQPVLLDPEGVFPDASCPVIHQISDLQGLVELNS